MRDREWAEDHGYSHGRCPKCHRGFWTDSGDGCPSCGPEPDEEEKVKAFEIAQKVTGELFDKGIVVAVGTARQLRQYDSYAACEDLEPNTPCVAVQLEGGYICVYVADEVYPS